jgi:hypothetical protein
VLEAQANPPCIQNLGPFRLGSFARPFGGGVASGDRFAAVLREDTLTFLLADAAGHGERGQGFWDRHEGAVVTAWDALVDGPGDLLDLRRFGQQVNEHLHAAGDHLCVSVGALSATGRLVFANFGYGTHVLPSGSQGAWWKDDPALLFGLKLGWLSPPQWESTERSFVGHELTDIRRVVALSDGFLGDDHRDPIGTLESLRALGITCAGLSVQAALDVILDRPHDEDDATALALAVLA